VRYDDGSGVLRSILSTATSMGFEDTLTRAIALDGITTDNPQLLQPVRTDSNV
jgi:hypothetical protein